MNTRRILIVGATSVLGGAVANILVSPDISLVLTYHRPGGREKLMGKFPAAQIAHLDVTTALEVDTLGRTLSADGGALDGLVYAAGAGLLWPASHTDDAKMRFLMDANVHGALRVARACWPALQRGKHPAIVFISSTMGRVGAAGMSGYGAAKAALIGLTQALAVEWAPRGIRVNAVAPGIVPSPLVDNMFKNLQPSEIEVIRKRHPLGFGEAADVGHAVAFLLATESKWITGVTLPVDGGYTAQ